MLLLFKFVIKYSTRYPGKNVFGNDAINISHGGYVAKQGKSMVYYIENKGLYLMNDNERSQKIADGNICSINIVGKWIYYVKIEKYKNENAVNQYNLYRLNATNGEEEKILENCCNVNVVGEKVYYLVDYDDIHFKEAGIFNYDPEGTNYYLCVLSLKDFSKQVIIAESVIDYLIYDNQLYYLTIDDQKLCSIKMDGSNKNEILSDINLLAFTITIRKYII